MDRSEQVRTFGVDPQDYRRRLAFLRWNDEDEARMRELRPLLAPAVDGFIEAFYAHLLAFPETAGFLADPAVLARAKSAQRAYFLRMLDGGYDASYIEQRVKIGLTHERVGLDPQWYLGAYAFYLIQQRDLLVERMPHDLPHLKDLFSSLMKLIFLDAGLALDAYIYNALERNRLLAEQLRRKSEDLEARNAALRAREAELRRANEEILRADKLKSEFLASMSHELRTPLNSILALSEVLLERTSGPLTPEQEKQVSIVRRNGRNLLALINDILDLSRIEAGRAQVLIERVRLEGLVGEVVETVAPLAKEKGLRLSVQVEGPLPALQTDRAKVSQVILNLVNNAVKFTDRGEVAVRVAPAGEGAVAVQVRDTGIGIQESVRPVIFEPFIQGDRGDARRYGGTGLGLAIAKRLLDLLGGRISFETKVGAGTTFTVVLPVASLEGEGAAEPRTRPAPAAPPRPSAPPSPASAPAGPRGERVLVIDDNADNAYSVRVILQAAGYGFLAAADGDAGLHVARAARPDLILLDLQLPRVSGYEVARSLKADAALRAIPVIALTARAMPGDREKALAAGCDDYVTKPIERASLLAAVERALAARR